MIELGSPPLWHSWMLDSSLVIVFGIADLASELSAWRS